MRELDRADAERMFSLLGEFRTSLRIKDNLLRTEMMHNFFFEMCESLDYIYTGYPSIFKADKDRFLYIEEMKKIACIRKQSIEAESSDHL